VYVLHFSPTIDPIIWLLLYNRWYVKQERYAKQSSPKSRKYNLMTFTEFVEHHNNTEVSGEIIGTALVHQSMAILLDLSIIITKKATGKQTTAGMKFFDFDKTNVPVKHIQVADNALINGLSVNDPLFKAHLKTSGVVVDPWTAMFDNTMQQMTKNNNDTDR
jgi:hypothetical protein